MSETSGNPLHDVIRAAMPCDCRVIGSPVPCNWCDAAEGVIEMVDDYLESAQQWRPLTSDPATWPEEGRRVVLWYPGAGAGIARWWRSLRASGEAFSAATHWLPLPDPPEVTQ